MTLSNPVYITSAAAVSPYSVPGSGVGETPVREGPRLRSLEPDYKAYIDPRLIRRMSRVVKMGAAAAVACLREADVEMPDAILTGTAYGCLEDTEVFLQRLLTQNEEMLTPTAFIQSTHNTIGAQIALMLQCHGYNNTYVHRAVAFENALLDAWLLLQEKEADTALVGGVDEMTDALYQILYRFDLYKKETDLDADSFLPSPGAVAGEGAAFVLLSRQKTPDCHTCLAGAGAWHKPVDMAAQTRRFLSDHGLTPGDVDLLLMGKNGDVRYDGIYDALAVAEFPGTPAAAFKHLCGEYPAASSFASWLAVQLLNGNSMPGIELSNPARNILIYNHFYHIHHSLILLRAC